MQVQGRHYRTVWFEAAPAPTIRTIDQRQLPHRFVVEDLRSVADVVRAIRDMHVRGAPAIGVAAAYGMVLAFQEAARSGADPAALAQELRSARPTAVNLAWAVDRVFAAGPDLALETAAKIAADDIEHNRMIGVHGLELIKRISEAKAGEPVQIMTHCNAGWLACVDHGTATSPIYAALQSGVGVHVWVSETRPRNQGAQLTAWELGQAGVPHTLIVDNSAGHLMQRGMVDLVIVGSDRTTADGDVANKIGTYLKALAARAHQIPFYVALPSSSIDWAMSDGIAEIPIEEREADEVRCISGVAIAPAGAAVRNFGFDVTPGHLVTGLITERGIAAASREGLLKLFPEQRKA